MCMGPVVGSRVALFNLRTGEARLDQLAAAADPPILSVRFAQAHCACGTTSYHASANTIEALLVTDHRVQVLREQGRS